MLKKVRSHFELELADGVHADTIQTPAASKIRSEVSVRSTVTVREKDGRTQLFLFSSTLLAVIRLNENHDFTSGDDTQLTFLLITKILAGNGPASHEETGQLYEIITTWRRFAILMGGFLRILKLASVAYYLLKSTYTTLCIDNT